MANPHPGLGFQLVTSINASENTNVISKHVMQIVTASLTAMFTSFNQPRD